MRVDRDVTVRRVAVGLALIAAAPLSVVSWVLVPTSMVEGEVFVSELRDMGDVRVTVSLVAGALFFPVAVIGVLGLMHLHHGRPTVLGTLGGGLAVGGLALNAVALGAAGALAEAARGDVDPAAAAVLVEETMGGATGLLALAGVQAAALGTTVLGIVLFRARTAPRVNAALLAAYGPIQVTGFATEVIPLIAASYVAMTLACLPVGLVFLRQTADEWRNPPVFGGIRRAAPLVSATPPV